MQKNFRPSVNLDLLDGYLFRLLQEIAEGHGLNDSGLYGYYGHRIERRIGGLAEYEARLARYFLDTFKDRPMVHAGTGIGPLPCVLACNGMEVVGVEADGKRVVSARYIREAMIEIWPEVEKRYQIVEGYYPEVLSEAVSAGPEKILLFTNVGAPWTEEKLSSIIRSMTQFGDVFLDLQLFGAVREKEEDRLALFDRIAASAHWAERLPHIAEGIYLARFTFR